MMEVWMRVETPITFDGVKPGSLHLLTHIFSLVILAARLSHRTPLPGTVSTLPFSHDERVEALNPSHRSNPSVTIPSFEDMLAG